MSQIISNFSFQLHLQHRGKGMGLQILRPNPQCPRDAAPRQRAGIGKAKLLAAVQRRYSFYRCLHSFDAYAFQRFVIQEKVKDLLIRGQRAASQKLMVA